MKGKAPAGPRPPTAQFAPPAPVQPVLDARRVQHPPGDEVHQILDVRGTRVEGGRGGDDRGAGVVQGDEMPQGLAVQRGLPYGDDEGAAFLQGDAGRALEQILGQAQRDPRHTGRGGRHDEHALRRVRPRGGARREIARVPVPHPADVRREGPGLSVGPPGQPFPQVVLPVGVPERDPRLVQQGQPGGPADHQVDGFPRRQQRPQHGSRIRRTGSTGHPHDPRHAPRFSCVHTLSVPACPPGLRPGGGKRRACAPGSGGQARVQTVRPRTSRSSRAHTKRAMPMKPLTLKNARLSRDRSCGRTIRCS